MIVRPLEIHTLKLLRRLGKKKVLVAVSGGVDSMALLHVCAHLQKKVETKLIIAHIHHGDGANQAFRDEALEFVGKACARVGLEFASNRGGESGANTESNAESATSPRSSAKSATSSAAVDGPASQSENDLRKFRLRELKKIYDAVGADGVLFAHHADDLLETRLIRLIRGTGPQGLTAMREVSGNVIRPFLGFSKAQVVQYMEWIEQNHLEDPSNSSVEYLRNWIRRYWLPELERKRPGSARKMAQSLISFVEALESRPEPANCIENFKIIRNKFTLLSASDKRRVLGRYLDQAGFKDYGLSHINELIKRLDVEQKDLTFRLLKKIWLANAKHIWCE